MGLYINKKDMQIPKTCSQCRFHEAIDCDKWRHVRSVYLDRHRDCPLLLVSSHGKLGDLDNLRKKIETICDRYDAGIIRETTCMNLILQAIIGASVIIPEEGEGI